MIIEQNTIKVDFNTFELDFNHGESVATIIERNLLTAQDLKTNTTIHMPPSTDESSFGLLFTNIGYRKGFKYQDHFDY